MRNKVKIDYTGFLFPKKFRQKRKIEYDNRIPEEIIQDQGDEYIKLKHIPCLRLPNALFRSVFANPNIPVHVKRIISDCIAGWADNILFIPVNDRFCVACMIEFKSPIGKLTGKQKERSKELPYNIVREFPELEKVIGDFEQFAGKIKTSETVKQI